MHKLVYTSNQTKQHHVGCEFDIYIRAALTAIDKNATGFITSKVESTASIPDGGTIVKTANSVYIFAYINNIQVCEYTGFGFLGGKNG